MSQKIYTAENPAKLLLVDDHPMLRRGLSDLLNLEIDVSVIGQANHGGEALDFLAQHDVDLIVLDHNMPIMNGIETLKAVREREIGVKVLLFTVSDNLKDVQDALELGADGYLLKDMEPEKIIGNIRRILRGELVISPALAPILAAAMRKPNQSEATLDLTDRELQVLHMIKDGMSNKMIGNKLGIAESTVKVHVKHILAKIGLRTRVEAAVWAVNHLPS
ncbi:transcriptional regulator NarL [Moraxella bovoculi]|uniref:Two-component system nitrate/nitrite response regulator NarL n=1 Tax=Moraxella bovoculi 237 TaxID=743974 RepID=A0A066UDV8_9GAMM|nr:two-component system response regulator NarL [Moraxella bovoculi]AKG14866.2 two-component system response regulator [Moraxella bovoculi]AKG16542.1 two-component system response regulator NarL [Moraxella bovoculi]AKG18278.1 transcriptional regulator NarL [Moraxella bovoculi]KDN25581.1 two-component system nitrate/nitrite response regulator NarL [Moraxella bovoculi 237]NSM10800.1 two-component system response regulator NarL [Moraxella bovoculi]